MTRLHCWRCINLFHDLPEASGFARVQRSGLRSEPLAERRDRLIHLVRMAVVPHTVVKWEAVSFVPRTRREYASKKDHLCARD